MKLIRSTALLALFLSTAIHAQTAPAPSITAHATAQIAAPLQIQCTGMQFGSLVATSTATSVTLPPDGSPALDPSGILLPGGSQNQKASNCSVSGDVAATYNVSLPSSVNLTDGSGHAMMLNTFAVSGDGDSNPLTRLLRNDGTGLGIDTFGVGAKVNVGANQPPGTYNGTFVVTVQYN
jgi:spore coat protein U-like protein